MNNIKNWFKALIVALCASAIVIMILFLANLLLENLTSRQQVYAVAGLVLFVFVSLAKHIIDRMEEEDEQAKP